MRRVQCRKCQSEMTFNKYTEEYECPECGNVFRPVNLKSYQ